MMRIVRSTTFAAAFGLAVPAVGQQWSQEELRDQSQGFHEEGFLAHLRQISRLVENADVAMQALCSSIHGDHKEYMLRISKLLDQLVDDRWIAREEAERTLIEEGGRALTMIEERANAGATLEERVRCARVRAGIQARGMEKEQAERELLRGYVKTAAYFPPNPRLARALLSALGHTDGQVVEGAIRALGAIGGDDYAEVVYTYATETSGGSQRQTALAALGRMKGERSVGFAEKLLYGDSLSTTEAVAMLRDLRARPEAAQLIAKLRSHPDPVIAAAASIEFPAASGSPAEARLTLSDLSELRRPFLGVRADAIVIREPVPGIPVGVVRLNECDVIDFDHPADPAEGAARVFLTQGSLVNGELVGITDGKIVIDTKVFGRIEADRNDVQGLAIDPSLDRLVGASTKHDRVRLRSGEFADGEVLAIAGDTLQIRTAAGDEKRIPLPDVAGVLFKRPTTLPQDANLYARLDLTNGDRLLVHLVAADQNKLGLVAPGLGNAVLPLTDVTHVEFGVGGGALWGFTLIADYSENRIVEIDDQGREVFALEEVYGAWDVECLDNGNLLITEFALNSVKEMTRDGKEVWLFEDLKNPNDADRLPNGNTLIADTFGDRVIEVNHAGEIVWQFDDQIKPYDVERLPNGNTLIADGRKDRVLEVAPDGTIVWKLENMAGVHDVDRLSNGNTLITQRTLHRVIEIARDGTEVFRIENLASPSDADRLPNGHTLIAENGRVTEYDRKGNKVWEQEIAWAVEVNRY